jgi:hypothetical protein
VKIHVIGVFNGQQLAGSKFDLKTGKAVAWSESVLGLPGTQFLGNIVGKARDYHDNVWLQPRY